MHAGYSEQPSGISVSASWACVRACMRACVRVCVCVCAAKHMYNLPAGKRKILFNCAHVLIVVTLIVVKSEILFRDISRTFPKDVMSRTFPGQGKT